MRRFLVLTVLTLTPPLAAQTGLTIYRDGRELPVEFGAWVTGGPRGYTINAFVHDISERKAAADRLARQALHDPLTGLPNRELFDDRLEQALRHLTRADRMLAVMFIDLDRF